MTTQLNRITIIIASIILLYGCSSVKEVQSHLSNSIIKVDGIQNEWEGKLYFDSKSKIAVGFQNDTENLYLCITTNDRTNIMKIFRLGLTIWLEPTGNGKKIGIKYPMVDNERIYDMPNRFELPDNERENPDERFKKLLISQNEVSIVNEDNYPLYLISNSDEKNIQAKIEVSNGSFVYELKIPLATNKQAKYFLESSPNEQIKIGILTNELKQDSPMGRPGSGMNRGDGRQPPQGEGAGRRSQGMSDGRIPMMNTDPLKLWFDVKLVNQ